MSSKAKKIEPPAPGANAWHYFNYAQKIQQKDDYDYQKTLSMWRQMKPKEQEAYKEAAAEAPRHKAKKGAQRSVSAYDILRRDLKALSEEDPKIKAMNLTTLASRLRKHLDENSRAWGKDGEKWLTTPTEDHYITIKRALKINKELLK